MFEVRDTQISAGTDIFHPSWRQNPWELGKKKTHLGYFL